jgi:hypothetical protein
MSLISLIYLFNDEFVYNVQQGWTAVQSTLTQRKSFRDFLKDDFKPYIINIGIPDKNILEAKT